MTRFDEIASELRAFSLKLQHVSKKGYRDYERTFRKIAYLSKAEEGGCHINQARKAVSFWWDNTKGGPSDVFVNCLAAMPLNALKKEYLKDKRLLKK